MPPALPAFNFWPPALLDLESENSEPYFAIEYSGTIAETRDRKEKGGVVQGADRVEWGDAKTQLRQKVELALHQMRTTNKKEVSG